ncbi:hypothetical protein BYT27DRAFT_7192743 [Phlegmacium glaucopus]|nr:hypothetical protein BYT27DRAFT_7192743 [Phlegmacium glaucopus]
MQLSHIPLPSFTLVLTSGHRSLYGDPIPPVPDHLMKTIHNSTHLEGHESSSDCIGENVDTQTVLESERPVTESHGGEQQAGNVSFKVCLHSAFVGSQYQAFFFNQQSFVLFMHKFLVLKRRFTRK